MLRIVTVVRDFLGDRDGSMTVEFVATLPLLLVALAFSFEFGKALWAYDVTSRDVRAAVRYLSRAPSSYTAQAECVAKTGSPAGAPSCSGASHFPWAGTSATFSYTTTAFSSTSFNQNGSVITMTANVPVTLSLLGFLCNNTISQLCIPTNYTLVVSDQIRWVGN